MTKRVSLYDEMTVDLPEGTSGNVTIEKFEITEHEARMGFIMGSGRGRTTSGTYTKLLRNGALWMSDTGDEKSDHIEALQAMQALEPGGRVLIGGLGLGMVLRAVITATEVSHIDVVEIDPHVVRLVSQTYYDLAAEHGKTITIHEGDLWDRQGLFGKPEKNHWDYAWMDIWLSLSTDNLKEMTNLGRKYNHYCKKIGYWGREYLRYQKRQDARRYAGW